MAAWDKARRYMASADVAVEAIWFDGSAKVADLIYAWSGKQVESVWSGNYSERGYCWLRIPVPFRRRGRTSESYDVPPGVWIVKQAGQPFQILNREGFRAAYALDSVKSVARRHMRLTDTSCHSDRDGECDWARCPQNRDGEPVASGRSCPLYDWDAAEAVA